MAGFIEENYWGIYNSVIFKQIMVTNISHQKNEKIQQHLFLQIQAVSMLKGVVSLPNHFVKGKMDNNVNNELNSYFDIITILRNNNNVQFIITYYFDEKTK